MHYITTFIEQFGYIAICLLIALENLFPPIPSEIILTFSGFFVTTSNLNLILVIIASTLGSLIGALFLYSFGRFFDYEKLSSFIFKYGKWFKVKQHTIDRAFEAFNQHGSLSVFFLRFVPVVRSFISIPAGMSKMALSKFFLLTTLASLIWNSILIILGYYAKEHYENIANHFKSYLLMIILLVFCIFIIYFIFKKAKKKY